MKAAWITFAKPGTEIDIKLIMVKNEVSRISIHINWKNIDRIKLDMTILIESPEIRDTPSLNFSAIKAYLFTNYGGILVSTNVYSGMYTIRPFYTY